MERHISESVLLVAPALSSDAKQQAVALESAGRLRRLVTSWIPARRPPASWVAAIPPMRAVARRFPSPVDIRHLVRVPSSDAMEWMTRLLRGSRVTASDRRFGRVDEVASRWTKQPTKVAIGREDACVETFRRARDEGIKCIYHLPTAHHEAVRRILTRESSRFPGACTVSLDPEEWRGERCQRKDMELALADMVLCPSEFVRASLLSAGLRDDRIAVLPFGGEPEWVIGEPGPKYPVFLFVGQISLRKGVHRLLRVWKRLAAYRTHRLRLVGAMRLSRSFLSEFQGLYEHVPWLERNRLRMEYAGAQALVLCALAEGLAIVIPEVMSCGTPVLASRNSGAEGFVTEGKDARLFAFDDEEEMASVLEWALTHPEELRDMGFEARRTASRWTWNGYRECFRDLVERVCPEV